MAVIIGWATNVNFYPGACVLSANWSFNPNAQRLYCLGTFEPNRIVYKPTYSVNFTVYAGVIPEYDISADQECVDFATAKANGFPGIEIEVEGAVCGPGSVQNVNGDFILASYNYSAEDISMAAQETWSLTTWLTQDEADPAISADVVAPSHLLKGLSEGQASHETLGGLSFQVGTVVHGSSGNVSAGQLGKYDNVYTGVVDLVGGTARAPIYATEPTNGSVSVQNQPLYLSNI